MIHKTSGKFQINIENTETGTVTELPWTDNAILDSWYSSQYAYNNLWYLHFGTGASPATRADTGLETPLNQRITSTSNLTEVNRQSVGAVCTEEITFVFVGAQGTVQGNVAELGLGQSTSATTKMFTRSLIKDGNGNPTTLSLGPNDILTVYYTITKFTDITATNVLASTVVDINGISTTCTLKYINWALGPLHAASSVYDYEGPFGRNETVTGTSYQGVTAAASLFILQRYATPFTGTIADESAMSINEVTLLTPKSVWDTSTSSGYIFGGVGVKKRMDSSVGNRQWLPGDSTGVWNGMFINYQSPSLGSLSGLARCRMMVTFDPPINKGENDSITFTDVSHSMKNS
jgi:hypothetical protein